ncbi:hypothetical protein ACHAXR_013282 [Thalassiosira sp. AJA248-18]
MVFINAGSRRDNPYAPRSSSISWKIYAMLSPKTWCALAIILLIWLLTLVTVVNENPEMKNEVLNDIKREENLIQGKIQRGRLRAKEWINKEKIWLANRLVRNEESEGDAEERKHQWDLSQLEDLALRTGPNDTPIHIVFSTDCSPYQHWQAYQFFLSALRIRQPGRVTQIASGCTTDAEKQSIQDWHAEKIAPLSFRFGLHLTPHFSSVKDDSGNTVGDYEFFNKPFGFKHWLEYGEGMGIDPATHLPWKHDTIIALLDPDQMLVKPITGHFESPNDIFRGGSMDAGSGGNIDSCLSLKEKEPKFTVRHGHPVSQEYGFAATKLTSIEALRSYAVGPPYISTELDAYKIAVKWAEFVPKVHHVFPQLMAEMYAYSIATAHLELPHQLMASLMVSDTSTSGGGSGGGGEGWELIDQIQGEEVCSFAMNSLDADVHPMPSVLHFCHRYGVGAKAFFAKKKVPKNFFSCESPLLEEPPMDIGSGKYLYKIPPFLDKKVEFSAVVEKREAFMICSSIGFLNEAALFYKNRHCGDDANLKKDIGLHDLPED